MPRAALVALLIACSACKEPPARRDPEDEAIASARRVPQPPSTSTSQAAACIGSSEAFSVIDAQELAGDTLTFCARVGFEQGRRSCLALNLATGEYAAAPMLPAPKNFYDDPPVGIPKSPETPPAMRMSRGGNYSIITTNAQIRVCKGTTNDCSSFPLLNFRPTDLAERFGGSRIPADISDDASTIAVVRHEGGKGKKIFGELYHVWKGYRMARFPIEADEVVKKVVWLGNAYLFLLACIDDGPRCEGKIFDVRKEKLRKVDDVNFCCTPHDGFFNVKGDTWAFFDGAGNAATWEDLKTGRIDRKIELREPLYAEGAAFGRYGKDAYVIYSGSALGNVAVMDLETGDVKKRYAAAKCAKAR